MRSTLSVIAASLLSMFAFTWLGLNGTDDAMVRASNTEAGSAGPTFDDALVGPQPMIGPRVPGAPRLRLASAEASEREPSETGRRPVRLRVGAIGIDAPIVATGVDAGGRLEVPDPDDVGWYEHGPAPGTAGSAVLAAHVDLGHERAVFFSLEEVEPGDRIDVAFDDGSTESFEVVDNVLYDKTALPSGDLFRRDGGPVLHLVTCGGRYDPAARHYLGNRIVAAVPVGAG